ncbi:NfeD family protein [Legionella saoudiensis]|uniref:NfeD family protein n=1 Tax=Legionella saoudiensis TaxID=1750561 RepID=UPI000AA44001|nr:nodulation protein NfeD [Legionella saoudiensis]
MRYSGLARKIIIILFSLLTFTTSLYAAKIVELSIKGPIGPATADYIVRDIKKAQHADLILVLLDTPGGLNESMRTIIQTFLGSHVPIVVYVSPTGARAASAGTYILYAATLAAMAPGTQLGAASPVNLSTEFAGTPQLGEHPDTMDKKVTNDAVATIRSLAQLRGRDPVFAQKAVLNAETITATEALKQKVINFIATDEQDLLTQLNGLTVTQNNQKITLNTSNPQIERENPDWRTYFLSLITDPTMAYLLLLLGIYGIFFELVNPGFVLPGVIGAIALLIAFYALQLLPVNYAGFLLIIVGIGFIIAEAFLPTFGSLGVGGTIAFLIGSIMLIDSPEHTLHVAWSVIGAMAVVNIIIFIIILGSIIRARHQRLRHGVEVFIGSQGQALGDINLKGQVLIHGEIWSASARQFIAAGKPVIVVGSSGLVLHVEEETGTQGE